LQDGPKVLGFAACVFEQPNALEPDDS